MNETHFNQMQVSSNKESGNQITGETNYVPLNDNELMVDVIKDSLFEQDVSSQKPQFSQKMTADLSDETLQRISSFVADIANCNFVQLDEKVIADSSIESLIMLIIMLLEEDLQESQRLSEQTLKSLKVLEKKCMQEAKEKYEDHLYSSAVANTIGAIAPILLTGRGMDPTAAGLIGKGVSSAGSVTDGWRQQGISNSQMEKQQASKVTDQERSDNQRVMKGLQDLKSFLEQVLQLRLQAARNN